MSYIELYCKWTVILVNIWTWHHYTDSPVKAAADAINAGTCLEDADSEDNVFKHLGEAVKAV